MNVEWTQNATIRLLIVVLEIVIYIGMMNNRKWQYSRFSFGAHITIPGCKALSHSLYRLFSSLPWSKPQICTWNFNAICHSSRDIFPVLAAVLLFLVVDRRRQFGYTVLSSSWSIFPGLPLEKMCHFSS